MVVRQTDADKTRARFHKNGLSPKDYFPEGRINELWSANNLWNNLVAINKKGQNGFQEARYLLLSG